jgi:hypothetical protein
MSNGCITNMCNFGIAYRLALSGESGRRPADSRKH